MNISRQREEKLSLYFCCCGLVTQSCLTLLRTHGLQPTWLLCQWDLPGKNPGMGCHFLLQGSSSACIKPKSPALAGRIFITDPPGKSMFQDTTKPSNPMNICTAIIEKRKPAGDSQKIWLDYNSLLPQYQLQSIPLSSTEQLLSPEGTEKLLSSAEFLQKRKVQDCLCLILVKHLRLELELSVINSWTPGRPLNCRHVCVPRQSQDQP